jgi:hypothetical protein
VLFSLILFGYGISYLINPSKKISETEKRKLAQFPLWSFDQYLKGVWIDSVDKFVNDQAPFRLQSVTFASTLNHYKGFQFSEKERIVSIKKPNKNLAKKNSAYDTASAVRRYLDDFTETASSSFLIINGSVFTLNSGVPSMSKYFADMLNKYARELKNETRVFSCVPPLSSAFIPVKKYEYYNKKNQETLLAIRASLSDGSIFCDVLGELNRHTDKKIFFSTDHHWTAYGAYYAYVSFCKKAGFEPVPLENMTKKVKYNFLGTLYELTRDKAVEKNPDTLDYFIPKVETYAVTYKEGDLSYPYKTEVFCERCYGGYSYSTFLCGDLALIKIKTNVKNGKKAMVIKNSMGNAFSVFLISHYEELYIIDYRYSEHNLLNLIRDNHINDLIFAPSLYAANAYGTIQRMYNLGFNNGLVRQAALKARIEKDSIFKNAQTYKDSLELIDKKLFPDE